MGSAVYAMRLASCSAACTCSPDGCVQVQGGFVRAEWDGNGLELEQPGEDLREQVLARVLLHVVVAARPVDHAFDPFPWPYTSGRRQHVQHHAILRNDIHHRLAGEHADIVGLAARSGVEERAVEHERGFSVHRPLADYRSGERRGIRICEVQSFGHKKQRIL